MSDQKACKCGWTGSVDFLEMVLVDEQKHEYEARCPKCSHEITDNPTPTPMSEDTNTTQSAEEKLIEAMCITYCHEFGLLDADEQTAMNMRMRQVLNNDIKPFWSEQLAQAKVPSDEDIRNYWANVFDPKTKADELTAAQLGAICTRDLMLPYITRIEQENAELKKHGYDNMQYYMEYCQRNGYVTPQEWIEKHKHF